MLFVFVFSFVFYVTAVFCHYLDAWGQVLWSSALWTGFCFWMVDTYYGASIIIFSLSLCLSYFRCFTSSITFQISDLFIFIIFFACLFVKNSNMRDCAPCIVKRCFHLCFLQSLILRRVYSVAKVRVLIVTVLARPVDTLTHTNKNFLVIFGTAIMNKSFLV